MKMIVDAKIISFIKINLTYVRPKIGNREKW